MINAYSECMVNKTDTSQYKLPLTLSVLTCLDQPTVDLLDKVDSFL
jgi:hypothetical protein